MAVRYRVARISEATSGAAPAFRCAHAGYETVTSGVLGEIFDDAVEPLVHAAQLGPEAFERGREPHFGRRQILVARIIAREFDAGLGELRRDQLGPGECGGCGY